MAICARYRISHSHFLGGPPVWTRADRDKAIWWQLRESERCDSCGTRKAEWDADRLAYTAVPVQCPGCEAKERTEASISTERDGRGVRVEMHRRQGAKRRG